MPRVARQIDELAWEMPKGARHYVEATADFCAVSGDLTYSTTDYPGVALHYYGEGSDFLRPTTTFCF